MIPLAIKSSGMVTNVGFNSPASLAAIRAGISGVRETNLWDAETGTYLQAGRVLLPHWWVGRGKLVELVAPAIYECLVAAGPTPPDEIPILLGVSSLNRPYRFKGIDENILTEIEYKLGIKLNSFSRIIPSGRVSGAHGIQLARQLIEANKAPCCIVAGVDSYLQQEVVEVYMQQRRILTPVNSNGFIPGEAGSAILVMPISNHAEESLQILGVGNSREKAIIESEEPLRGDGLTKAVRKALKEANLNISDTSYRITDLNGEHYKFKESSFVVSRLLHKRKEELFDIWHPIEYIGEVGAAIFPIIFGLSLDAFQKGYAPGDIALCYAGNDDGERSAVIVKFKH